MQNHFKNIIRSFMGVYRPHQARALLLLDNGSVRGNKSYVQDLNFLGQPLNLLSKNRIGFCLTAVTKTLAKAFPGDNPCGLLPCYGNPFPEGLEDQQFSKFNNNIQKRKGRVEKVLELFYLKDLIVRGLASSTGTRPVVSAHKIL